MERLIQLFDDLDDLVAAIGLMSERLRQIFFAILGTCATLTLQIGGVFLALVHPPIALAMALMLFVGLLYHSVTEARFEIALK